ncbi:hypothetical protein MMC29_000275 [Sticta canariensis]|nr:hypothetical protein [Sticta canariensis]
MAARQFARQLATRNSQTSKKATLGRGGTLVSILGPSLDFWLRLTTSKSAGLRADEPAWCRDSSNQSSGVSTCSTRPAYCPKGAFEPLEVSKISENPSNTEDTWTARLDVSASNSAEAESRESMRAGKPLSSNIPISEGQQGVQGAHSIDNNQKGKAKKKRIIGVKRTKEVTDSNGHRLAVDERSVTIHEQIDDLSQANETTSQPAHLQAHGKKRKKHKSIGQKPRLQNVDREPEGSTQPPAEALRPVNYRQEHRVDLQGELSGDAGDRTRTLRDSTHDLGAEEAQNLTVNSAKSRAERKPRRKKRKCIGQQMPRRKGTAVETAGDTVPSTRSNVAGVAPEYQDGSSTVKKSRGSGRPSKKSLLTVDIDGVQDERPARKEVLVDAKVQEEKNENDDNEGPSLVEKYRLGTEESRRERRKRSRRYRRKDPDYFTKALKNSMPITVYRMSTNDALDSENDRSSDSLISPSVFPKNNGVNAVDVLAQICRELVSKSINSLGDAAKNERN